MEMSVPASHNQLPSTSPVALDSAQTTAIYSMPNQMSMVPPEGVPVSLEVSEPQADEHASEPPLSFKDVTEPMADDFGSILKDKLVACESPAEFLELREDLSLFKRATQVR